MRIRYRILLSGPDPDARVQGMFVPPEESASAAEARQAREEAERREWIEELPSDEDTGDLDEPPNVEPVKRWLDQEPSDEGYSYVPVDAPKRVAVQREGEEDLRVLRRWFEEGTLKRNDLVDVGQGWQSVEECPLFSTLVYQLQDRARRKAWWIYVLVVLGCLLLARLLIL
jgi:hypothetical protein